MQTKSWLGGALVLSLALSLAAPGSAWAQSREREAGKYETGQEHQKAKKQQPTAKSGGDLGVCTPESCSGSAKTPKPAPGRTSAPEKAR